MRTTNEPELRICNSHVLAAMLSLGLGGCAGTDSTSVRQQDVTSTLPDAGTETMKCRAVLLVKPVPQSDLWVRIGTPVDLVDGRDVIQAEPVTNDLGEDVYLSVEAVAASTP